jgi:hypothetical protein
MLVFFDRQFLQVLEGNPADVIAIDDHLAEDPRHDNLIVLHRGYSNVGKTFSGLSVGFHVLALNDKLPNGFVIDQFSFYQFDGLAALDFLLACRPGLRRRTPARCR